MKITIRSILVVALSLGAFTSFAQPQQNGPGGPGGPRSGRGHRPPSPLLIALDANTNGVLEASEIANASIALKALDKNGDGKLTAVEVMPQFRGGVHQVRQGLAPAGKHPVPPVIAAIDTNGDGELDTDEIAGASAALLKLDANRDGQLTPDELRPQRPDGAGSPGEGPGPGGLGGPDSPDGVNGTGNP